MKPYQQIVLQLYKKYPELTSDIWIKIIQQVKIKEKDIYKKINKRSYYNYKIYKIFDYWKRFLCNCKNCRWKRFASHPFHPPAIYTGYYYYNIFNYH